VVTSRLGVRLCRPFVRTAEPLCFYGLVLLNPSSMKRRISSAILMPVRFDAALSALICGSVSMIVVRFMAYI
jgi:hypothetical protein